MRSESVIKNLNFVEYIDRYFSKGNDFAFLENRVVIPASYPAVRGELFHIGDWYYFGHTKDVMNLWDLPYMNDEEYNKKENDLLFNPHRYLITSFVKKYYPLEFKKKTDITWENRKIYEAVLAQNFVITGFYEYGIVSLKYPLSGSFFNKLFHKEVGYTFNEWKELYNDYSGGEEMISKNLDEILTIKLFIPIKRTIIGQILMKVRARIFKLHYWE